MYITGNKCRNYKMKMEKKKNLFKYIWYIVRTFVNATM
jgi:hypothetical protein